MASTLPNWVNEQVDYYRLSSATRYCYRYVTVKRAIELLENGTIYIGSLAKLNDPRESTAWRFGLRSRSVTNLPDDITQTIRDSASQVIKGHAKVFCATRDHLEGAGYSLENLNMWGRGFCKLRMWAQYSDQHQGVCLIFDFAELDQAIRYSKPSASLLWTGNVRYVNEPRIPHEADTAFLIEGDRVAEVGLETAIREHVLVHKDRFFFCKAIDWRDENEFRWLLWDTQHANLLVPFKNALKGVIAGHCFDDQDWGTIERLCVPHKILPVKMNWVNGTPDLIHRGPNLALHAELASRSQGSYGT